MDYHISEYLEFEGNSPTVSGIVENINTLNRLKPWIGDLISNEFYDGREVEATLVTEYEQSKDVYMFKLVFEEC
jgi:tRNA splicing ligase|tara:strand:- start:2076 stop:2297 length:222 start_codon:yes stop_codon:yes gene_type:complete